MSILNWNIKLVVFSFLDPNDLYLKIGMLNKNTRKDMANS
jgi:hypothetical protein